MRRRREKPRLINVDADPVNRDWLRIVAAERGLRVPPELMWRLMRYCQESGLNLNNAVVEALEAYLAGKGRSTSEGQ